MMTAGRLKPSFGENQLRKHLVVNPIPHRIRSTLLYEERDASFRSKMTFISAELFPSLSLRGARKGDVAISQQHRRRLLRHFVPRNDIKEILSSYWDVACSLRRSFHEQHYRDFSVAVSRLARNDRWGRAKLKYVISRSGGRVAPAVTRNP